MSNSTTTTPDLEPNPTPIPTPTPAMAPRALPEQDSDFVNLKSSMSAHVYHQRIARTDASFQATLEHPLHHVSDFPGPMCLRRLKDNNTLTELDASTYFSTRFLASSHTRAHVARDIMPHGAIASGFLAAWIWLGGEFPRHIDVARDNHYHSILFGRKVRSTSRQIHSSFIAEFPQLLVTTPERTACDLACSEDARFRPHLISAMILELATNYDFGERDCIEVMRVNTRQPRYTAGMNLILRTFASQNAPPQTQPQQHEEDNADPSKASSRTQRQG
ncbi:hypothetical protein [Alloscardovia criceti]|uniref:hypothetical protein n=1 Tax=Alloscardovia criceti TaxID=356828 RepID=UPI0012EA0659|nr:hypothetical protein [Alloscardovia criceti]